jgi:DNA-binding transcriptional ArsR family regulator
MNAQPPLPNPWNIFNLQASPYWQDPLGDEDAVHPMSLFVGRESELQAMLDGLFGAGASSSRRAVAGGPGVGKTTLVKRFKATALANGYLTADSLVPIVSGDTTESLFGRVLGVVYDIILANRPATHDHPAMRSAQVLVRAARELTRGGGISFAGFGGSATQGVSFTAPREILIDGARVMRDLMLLVQGSDARGVVVHVNNFENLGETAVQQAATVLRDLRDPMMMHGGLHLVVVGTPEAIQTAVMTHPQVRTTFSLINVPPFTLDEVHALLARRYAHLRRDGGREAMVPVSDEAVALLHTLFRGDLRGLLKALEDGVTPMIGLLDTIRPLSSAELSGALQHRYARELEDALEESRVRQLTRWGTGDPTREHTQKSLTLLWELSQPSVSQALTQLMRSGYVIALPRERGSATRYALSGVARLVFGTGTAAD